MPPSPEEKTPGQDNSQNPIDLDSILLPKKETGPNKESAQRVNAGALLAQEESAALPKPEPAAAPVRLTPAPAPAAPVTPPSPTDPLAAPKPVPPPPASAPNVAPFAKPATPPAAPATPAPAAPVVEESEVKPLQTFKGDLERVVTDKGVSVVSIAAAEAERRGNTKQETPEEADSRTKSYIMVASGVLLILIAAGVLGFFLTRKTTLDAPPVLTAPFIEVDEVAIVEVPVGDRSRDTLMTNLVAARQRSSLSLGLVEWLHIREPATHQGVAPIRVTIQELLESLAPQMPPELVRVLDGSFFVGVHSFDENQPILIFRVDSYEVAYKAMLEWERTMRNDLAPLFTRSPSPQLPSNVVAQGSSTPQFLQTGFVDKILENRDTRAIVNEAGDPLLLWTFVGRNIILITTNEYTLREVVSRFTTTPIVPTPGQ